MQIKKIFLASSEELESDRRAFELMVLRKNKEWVKRGVFFEPVVWEDFLDSVSRTRSQDEYNKAICDSDIFVMLYFSKVGKYTHEEFEVAYKQFQGAGAPQIFVYSKDGELRTSALRRDGVTSLLAFNEKLTELGHFPSLYRNTEGLLHDFSDQLSKLIDQGLITVHPAPSESSASLKLQPANTGYRFDVALSFPAQFPDFEHVIAAKLAEKFGAARVLYHDFHEVALSGPHADAELQRLLKDEAELVVVLLCADLEEQDWSLLDPMAIKQLLGPEREKRIWFLAIETLDLRNDLIASLGIATKRSYVNVGRRAPEEVAGKIEERLHHLRAAALAPVASSAGLAIAKPAVVPPPPARSGPAWSSAHGKDEYGDWAEFSVKGVVQRMRWIPPGEFLMGSLTSEAQRETNETQHKVILTRGYWLADTACTQALWQAVMGNNPSNFKDDPRNPVEQVRWDDVVKNFLPKLNALVPGLAAELPTEAQWEYACRAGTQTAFWFGDQISTDQVNYNGRYPMPGGAEGQYRQQTVPVKALTANGWGLHQMHGNVWEWCADWFGPYEAGPVTDPEGPPEGQLRVLRGGSWIAFARNCRSANRGAYDPGDRFSLIGFRLFRGLAAPGAEP